MTFSPEWDDRYREQTHLSVWPWSDLVSHVMRYARPDRPGYRVLELGCGAGADIPFFQWLGVDYCALEGSPAIVAKLRERFPELGHQIAVGDFTREIPFPGPFDLVCDRASLTHNTTAAIKDALALVRAALKPGARFIGIDWFSTEHSDYLRGREAEDRYTRSGIEQGTFAGVGRVHFSDRAHLEELFAGFRFESLEHKRLVREIPADQKEQVAATWNFVVSAT